MNLQDFRYELPSLLPLRKKGWGGGDCLLVMVAFVTSFLMGSLLGWWLW